MSYVGLALSTMWPPEVEGPALSGFEPFDGLEQVTLLSSFDPSPESFLNTLTMAFLAGEG